MYRTALLFLLLLQAGPFRAGGQSADHRPPLPQLHGVSMVVQVRYSFMPPPPGTRVHDKDTESVFLIGPDGFAHTRYFSGAGGCVGKETYAYADGLLARRSNFRTISRHSMFAAPSAHVHRLVSVQEWEYRTGLVTVERQFAGPDKTLTHEARYFYDNRARVTEERHKYPRQNLIYYPQPADYVQYQYRHDSVWKYSYLDGRLRDSSVYIQRRNHAGQIMELASGSADGSRFERELHRYDTAGRESVYELFSDRPSVKADGTVLHADRVEYVYDSLGRPDEARYLARGIKRWTIKYGYLR